jgi:hypothetical protein
MESHGDDDDAGAHRHDMNTNRRYYVDARDGQQEDGRNM